MARKKNFNVDNLLTGDKNFNKSNKLLTVDGFDITYSKELPMKKVDKLIDELMKTQKHAVDNELVFPVNDNDILEYMQYLIFKYFTNLEELLSDRSVEDNIVALQNAYNNGWMDLLFEKVDDKEVGKVTNKFFKVLKGFAKLEGISKLEDENLKN